MYDDDSNERWFFWGFIVPGTLLLWGIVLGCVFAIAMSIYRELGL